jgi:L-alanine-DL-glutamate epimerase-like enolase superfamily enzyme
MRARTFTVHAPIPGTGNAVEHWVSRTVVRLVLEGPHAIGIGEAPPLPGLSTEGIAELHAALRGVAWPDRVEDVEQIEEIVATIPDALPSGRFAAETALLDMLGRERGEPVWRLLGEQAEARPLCQVLWVNDEASLLRALGEALTFRLPALKMKIGRPGRLKEELGWLRQLRGQLPEVELRLDANGALPVEQAQEVLDALVPFAPSFVEEPTEFEAMLELASPVPLAVDESLAGPEGPERLERALASRSVGVVVLKPALLGGVLAARRYAERASEAGALSVVSHLLDGPISRAAAAHLALVLGGLAPGLGEHPALGPLSDGILVPWMRVGRVDVPDGPGLGLGIAW